MSIAREECPIVDCEIMVPIHELNELCDQVPDSGITSDISLSMLRKAQNLFTVLNTAEVVDEDEKEYAVKVLKRVIDLHGEEFGRVKNIINDGLDNLETN